MDEFPGAYDFAARNQTRQVRKGAAAKPCVNHAIDIASRVARSGFDATPAKARQSPGVDA